MLTSEEWKAIPGYEGSYEASTSGRIRSLARTKASINRWKQPIVRDVPERILSARADPLGYYRVNLSRDGVVRTIGVHRLVCMAFYGDRQGMHAAHFDGNPSNNVLSNLRWATAAENLVDKVRHGTHPAGTNNGRAKLQNPDVDEIAGRLDETSASLAAEFGISRTEVLNIQHGRVWGMRPNEPAKAAIKERIRTAKAKLSWDDVRAIRAAPNATTRALAAQYGVCPSNITAIRRGKTWRE